MNWLFSELRYQEDRRTLGFVATYMTLVGVGWVMWDSMPVGLRVAWVAATCVFSFFCAVITHNTIHVAVFKKRSWNRLWQYIISVCYGHPVSAFVPGHNLSHHLHTQSRRDVMRSTKVNFRWNLLNQLLFMPALAGDISNADFQYARAMRTERPKWFAQWVREWVFFLAVLGTLLVIDLGNLPAGLWPQGPAEVPGAIWAVLVGCQKFLLLAMLPHLYAAWGIIGINYIQHDGTDQNHPYNHSRNFVGKFVNWWTFNNGFHGIHHKYPGLHWSKAPAVHAKEIAPYIHPSLDQTSLLVYLFGAYGFPGKRVMYDGSEYVFPEEGPDEEWIPGRGDTPENVSLGAEAA
ncbi:MAG: fatty acid desaturase [Deltaproteobacteria bacterium]|nr:fatty acid desaturase [Deltaproteobacteria bacterium]